MDFDPLDWFTTFVTQTRADVAEEIGDDVAPTVICFIRKNTPCAIALCQGDNPVGYELARIGAGAFEADEVLVCFDAYMTIGEATAEQAGELVGEMSRLTLGPKQPDGQGTNVLMVVQARREGDLGLWVHPYQLGPEKNQITYGETQDVGAVGFLGGPGADKLRDSWSTTSFEEYMQMEAQETEHRNLSRIELDRIAQQMLPQVFPCKLELLREAPESNLN